MQRSLPHMEFWSRFVADTALLDRTERCFEPVRIGDSEETAEAAAQMVLSGAKTASSTLKLAHDADGTPLPRAGGLGVLEDGAGRPVAMLETTEVVVARFAEIDDAFARAHGDWGGSLKSWRRQCRAEFAARCRMLGRPFGEDTEIVCERFRVLYVAPERAVPPARRGR